MTGKPSIAVIAVLVLGFAFCRAAWADPAADVCAALVNARSSLYSMLSAKDKSARDALHAKLQEASAKVDSVLAGMPRADAKRATDFKAIWEQFKLTRDKEIIPALDAGNAAEAKRIADGVQYQRLSQMWSIMSCKAR
jgi:hypothetical protein